MKFKIYRFLCLVCLEAGRLAGKQAGRQTDELGGIAGETQGDGQREAMHSAGGSLIFFGVPLRRRSFPLPHRLRFP